MPVNVAWRDGRGGINTSSNWRYDLSKVSAQVSASASSFSRSPSRFFPQRPHAGSCAEPETPLPQSDELGASGVIF